MFKSVRGQMKARAVLCRRIIDMVERPDLHNLTRADMAFGVNLVKVNAPHLYDRARNEFDASMKRRGGMDREGDDVPVGTRRREHYYSPEEHAVMAAEQREIYNMHRRIRDSNRRDQRVKLRWLNAKEKLQND